MYMYQAKGSIVQTGSHKIACYFVGPLVIYKAIGPNQFLLISLTGQIYPYLIEETRLKPGTIWISKGNVSTLAELKGALNVQIFRRGHKTSSKLRWPQIKEISEKGLYRKLDG